jgi:hypothetical protein
MHPLAGWRTRDVELVSGLLNKEGMFRLRGVVLCLGDVLVLLELLLQFLLVFDFSFSCSFFADVSQVSGFHPLNVFMSHVVGW